MKWLRYILPLLLLVGCKSRNEVSVSWDAETNIAYLWETIDTKYCFVEDKGIDWDEIRTEYIAKAKTLDIKDEHYQEQLFDLMAGMLDSLHDGHVNLYSWFDVSRNTDWYNKYPTNFNSNILYSKYLTDYRTSGGMTWTILEPEKIGYIYYGSFSNSCGNINALLSQKMKDCKGLIIDVRNNGGGDLENAYILAAPFFEQDTIVGYWQHKTGPEHDAYSKLESQRITAGKVKWKRPTMVLSNRHSYSATNFFINCVKSRPKVTIIGGKSGGGGGMPMSYELPCGWLVRFSSIRMFDIEKVSIEEGIDPDVPIQLTSTDKDDIIEKAIEIIKQSYQP